MLKPEITRATLENMMRAKVKTRICSHFLVCGNGHGNWTPGDGYQISVALSVVYGDTCYDADIEDNCGGLLEIPSDMSEW